ncbi:MAG: hypothetical protein GY807_16675 [Gammaproteobacteria bacterium]|nr:hypothetical protein [Gammaproteobacteria bacterium]
MNEQVRKLALLGCTDKQIADFFEIDESTINRWKKRHPAFCLSLREGKIVADAEVADSLYRRAKGETRAVEKAVKGPEGIYEIITVKQHVPADPGAAKLWLTNRQPEKWRDKREHAHTGRLDIVSKEQRDAAVAAALRADT